MYVSATSMRLSFGMSTPEIRATRLPLPLLVFWIFANDHDAAVPADNLALVATWLDGCSDLHDSPAYGADGRWANGQAAWAAGSFAMRGHWEGCDEVDGWAGCAWS